MDTTSRDTPAVPTQGADRVRLAWPPPGLETVHDTLWPVVRLFLAGAVIFAAPLLLALADDSPYWSLGPFGQSWWIPIATAVFAFVLLLLASIRLAQLLRAGARGAALGYSARVIAAVAADRRRDTGFVLQAARSYATMTTQQRAQLMRARVLAPVLYLFAAMWVPLALTVTAALGYARVLGPAAMLLITLALPAAAVVMAMLANAYEATLVVRARRAVSRLLVDDETRHDANNWNTSLQLLTNDDRWHARPAPLRALRWSSIAVVVPALLMILPLAAITVLLALGPLLASIAAPNISGVQSRHAAVAVLRPYRLAPDAAISAVAAGSALHNLSSIGGTPQRPLMRPPERTYAEPWFHTPEQPLGPPASWSTDLFTRVRAGLTPDARDYLARVAAHPAHREYEIVARAGIIDIAGARYVTPLPDTLAAFDLPIPRFGMTREGAYAHIGKAAHELSLGNAAQAEQTVREVVSVGLVMADNGPTLIDALIGIVIANTGGVALEDFYRATQRTLEAERLHIARVAAAAAAEVSRAHFGGIALSHWLQQTPQAVTDTMAMRGLRWEQYMLFNTLSPCINLHQAVFGRDEHYHEWLRQAEHALVRHPGERALFDLGRTGLMRGTGVTPDRCGASAATLRELLWW